MSEHRRTAGESSGDVADSEGRRERGSESLRNVEQDHRDPVARPEGAPDVRGADVPSADRAYVDTAGGPHDPVSKREAAGEIAGDDEGESLDRYFRGT